MKKLLSITLIATLLLSLVACGKPYTPAPNPPLVLGEKFLTDLDYEAAVLQFDQAIQIDPKNPRGYFGKADALLHLDRFTDAADVLGAGARAVPKDQREHLQAAQAEVEKSPEDGYIGLSSAYESMGWRDIALLLLKRVAQEFPTMKKVLDKWIQLSATLEDAAYFDGSVYQVFDIGMTWYEAKAHCEGLGGHLVTITSQAEQEFIEGLLQGHDRNIYWLGGTDAAQKGQWEWISGELFEYSNWDDGQPDNYGGIEHYLQINGSLHDRAGKWNDLSHNGQNVNFSHSLDTIGFICEWETGYQGSIETIPSNAAHFNGSAYQVYSASMTWYEAKAFCESIGGHLATITSQEEQEFVEQMVLRHGDLSMFWIGLFDEDWEWKWVTGEPLSYTNWSPGEPTGGQTAGQPFGLMFNQTEYFELGKWLDNPNEGVPGTIWAIQDTGFVCEWNSQEASQ